MNMGHENVRIEPCAIDTPFSMYACLRASPEPAQLKVPGFRCPVPPVFETGSRPISFPENNARDSNLIPEPHRGSHHRDKSVRERHISNVSIRMS